MAYPLEQLGVVVIGRNEAPRLGACLDSLASVWNRLVYVDSGSADVSPEIAESRGVHVIRLTEGPWSAARGRQIGLDELCRLHPELQYVQFVDGDCIIQPGWLDQAARFLVENPTAGAVTGGLRELHADRCWLTALLDVDWRDLPTGDTDALGGLSLTRLIALRQIGGWNQAMIVGEDLDLGTRLKAHGWKLIRLPQAMALHDLGVGTIGEFWRRCVRTGFCYAKLAQLYPARDGLKWRRRVRGNLVYGAVMPAMAVSLLFAWPPVAFGICVVYLLLIFRIFSWRVRQGDPCGFSLLYALVLAGTKPAGAYGVLKFYLLRLTGGRERLIEYKTEKAATRT
jgi:glycosyltransferase involved in cell wall biosynthesis